MRRAIRITILVVAVAALLTGCGPLDKSHWAAGHLSGNKTFALDLVYGGKSSTLAAAAYADVADGTAGTLELTGKEHWRCQGQFRAHVSNGGLLPWDPENLPALTTPDGGPVVNFSVPPGSYTVRVRIPMVHADLKESATLDRGRRSDARTGYNHDAGCVPVADTLAQQKALITQYLDGMQQIAHGLGKADLRTLIDQAREESASANQSTDPAAILSQYSLVTKNLNELKDAARADFPNLPPYVLIQAADDTMALLSQTGLH
jgi:hypothetical protein